MCDKALEKEAGFFFGNDSSSQVSFSSSVKGGECGGLSGSQVHSNFNILSLVKNQRVFK